MVKQTVRAGIFQLQLWVRRKAQYASCSIAGASVFKWRDSVIELDLEKFFDKVNHDRLMSTLEKKLKDKPTLKLIHSYLSSRIMEGEVVSPRTRGTPHGSFHGKEPCQNKI